MMASEASGLDHETAGETLGQNLRHQDTERSLLMTGEDSVDESVQAVRNGSAAYDSTVSLVSTESSLSLAEESCRDSSADEVAREAQVDLGRESQQLRKERIAALTEKSRQVECMHKVLSDAGVYSYAALCALLLHQLFDNKWDHKFNKLTLKMLLEHLHLPKQVLAVMSSLLEGQGSQTPEAYVALLESEPALEGRTILLVQDLILLAVKEGCYDARMRVLITHVAQILDVPVEVVNFYEESFVEFLVKEREQTETEKLEGAQRQRSKKVKRFALIGLATVGGGALIGLTGGLAAPLIGAGIGTILGGAGMAALTSTASIAIIGSLFGVAGAGLSGFKMKKRVGDVEEFSFSYLNCGEEEGNHEAGEGKKQEADESKQVAVSEQLHVAIAVSGWLSDDREDNFARPWRCLDVSREQYCLRYESKYLLELGQAMDMIVNAALSVATQQALKMTILQGLLAAIAWPANLLALSSLIDNPWGVSCRRSSEVGKHLADVLMSREQGQRPVTLVGFSLGARVIFYCLREMSTRGGCEGIVQDAVMLGAPVTGHANDWEKLTRVVAGRIVNGYCRSDWLLKFLYRKLSVTSQVAGLQPVELKDRRMVNVDLGEVIQGHGDYPENIDLVLRFVGVQTSSLKRKSDLIRKSASELPRSNSNNHINTSLLSLRPSMSESNLRLPSASRPITEQDSTESNLRLPSASRPITEQDSTETNLRLPSASRPITEQDSTETNLRLPSASRPITEQDSTETNLRLPSASRPITEQDSTALADLQGQQQRDYVETSTVSTALVAEQIDDAGTTTSTVPCSVDRAVRELQLH